MLQVSDSVLDFILVLMPPFTILIQDIAEASGGQARLVCNDTSGNENSMKPEYWIKFIYVLHVHIL